MDMSGWSYVDNISPGRKHPQCWRQTRPLADALFQPGSETSSLLAANASFGGSAVPARVGDILTVGGKRVRFAERLFQAGFTGNRIGGFHGTSLQSNMESDIYACKELFAALRRLVARSFDQASNGSLCLSTSFLRGLQADFQILSYTAGHPFFEMSCSFTYLGDPNQKKYLTKSLCLAWLCWCWRHAACIPTGTDYAWQDCSLSQWRDPDTIPRNFLFS